MGGVPSGPGTLLVCQSAMPKHLKGKTNKKVSLGLGPMVYLVLFHFEFCQILRGGGAKSFYMQDPLYSSNKYTKGGALNTFTRENIGNS